MEALKLETTTSAIADTSPMVLSEIFSPEFSIAIWQRPENQKLTNYFATVFKPLGMGLRAVFDMDSLRTGLEESLPDAPHKNLAIDDIYLLSDMLTCLFNCNSVGLRLVPLDSAMCPKFHTDNIPVRLVNTYLGPGTQWLPAGSDKDQYNQSGQAGEEDILNSRQKDASAIQQLNAYEVALLKGSAWDNQEQMACIHRSCQVKEHQQRVLLTLDPM